MVIVAGLPPTIHNDAVSYLKERFPQWEVIGAPSTSRDHGDLYPPDVCRVLSESATEFAIRKRRSGKPVSPRAIILLYVPAGDAERLLSMFDFVVMPEPMLVLQAWDERGRQQRHNLEAVREAMTAALAASGRARMALNVVSQRLKRLADDEELLLPARTFLTRQGPLAEEFKDFRKGVRQWGDRLTHLGPTELTRSDIERIPSGKTRRAFVDERRIAYLVAHPTAFHAPARQIDNAANADQRIELLRSLYRFGGALELGFHHDATHSDDSKFLRTPFRCSVDGDVLVSGSYVNVYPDDYIRVTKGKKDKIKKKGAAKK